MTESIKGIVGSQEDESEQKKLRGFVEQFADDPEYVFYEALGKNRLGIEGRLVIPRDSVRPVLAALAEKAKSLYSEACDLEGKLDNYDRVSELYGILEFVESIYNAAEGRDGQANKESLNALVEAKGELFEFLSNEDNDPRNSGATEAETSGYGV